MNRSPDKAGSTNSAENVRESNSPSAAACATSSSSSSSSPLMRGVSRISIGHSTNTAGGNGANASNSSLMNGNGELIYRRSPIAQSHYQQQNQSNNLSASSPNNNANGKNYYTLGSPSVTTSYNSEDVSDILNSSSLDDYGTNGYPLNESLCLKVEQLQKQVESLGATQASQDKLYRRAKQENDELLNRVHSLEDQLRELEINSEKRARDDERRFKETMAKQTQLKLQECEQHLNANYQLQQEIISLQKDLMKSESQVRSLRSEKEKIENELNEKNSEILSLDEEVHKLKLLVKNLKQEESVKSNLINILNEELVDNQNRSHQFLEIKPEIIPNDHLEADLSKLRDENKQLKELTAELQAQLLNVQLEEGRSLIQEGNKSYSLADELGDIDVHKLMDALKEQQEDNARLRKYMDDILLKIVDKHPEILEKSANSNGGLSELA